MMMWTHAFRFVPDIQKDNFFTQTWFQTKIFDPKKCVNYNKLKLQQNRVKGPKYPNSAKKMPKSNIKFRNFPKNAFKKHDIATLLTFSTKQSKILQRF